MFSINLESTGLKVSNRQRWRVRGKKGHMEMWRPKTGTQLRAKCGGLCAQCQPTHPNIIQLELNNVWSSSPTTITTYTAIYNLHRSLLTFTLRLRPSHHERTVNQHLTSLASQHLFLSKTSTKNNKWLTSLAYFKVVDVISWHTQHTLVALINTKKYQIFNDFIQKKPLECLLSKLYKPSTIRINKMLFLIDIYELTIH